MDFNSRMEAMYGDCETAEDVLLRAVGIASKPAMKPKVERSGFKLVRDANGKNPKWVKIEE